jgi:FtsP/CotA-like multicopper oxidase with cupredoxin domain
MFTRRRLCETAAILAGAGAVSGRAQAAAIPEAPTTKTNTMQPPLAPPSGPHYQPVVTLNGWTLPWRMNGDWKEFHLVAEPVEREFAPGMTVHLWGYNGQSPGPTIECVEGDKVRIFVTNKLPEHTSVHWHGMRIPNGMDGVGGLTQPHIEPGKTFAYEFALEVSGTFMYHPHSDEMVQMGMGMMGMFIVHPRDESFRRVDRDFDRLRAIRSAGNGRHVHGGEGARGPRSRRLQRPRPLQISARQRRVAIRRRCRCGAAAKRAGGFVAPQAALGGDGEEKLPVNIGRALPCASATCGASCQGLRPRSA